VTLDKDAYLPAEGAERLSVSLKTFYELSRAGLIRTFRLKGRTGEIRISHKAIQEYIASMEAQR
jgi:excisionase family DNA binding protein